MIAGIDPGTTNLGLAIIEPLGQRFVVLVLQVIKAPAKLDRWERIGMISEQLSGILRRHRPGIVAIERPFVARDPRAAMALGESVGTAMAAAWACGSRVIEFTPSQARKAAIGKGSADKHLVRQMVLRILGAEGMDAPLDATDAACLALAAANRS